MSSSLSEVSSLLNEIASVRVTIALSTILTLISLLALSVRKGVVKDFLSRFGGLTVSGVLVLVWDTSNTSSSHSCFRFLSVPALSSLLKFSLKVLRMMSSRSSVSFVSIN